jgi:hypothetical protein
MHTIKIETIDGYNIITGIHNATGLIDPEATKKKVSCLIEKTEVYGKIDKIKNQMQAYAGQAIQARKNAVDAKRRNDKEWKKYWDEFTERQGQMKELEKQLLPLAAEFKNKYAEMIIENAEYFSQQPGNEYISDTDAEEIFTLMAEASEAGQLVTVEKQKVQDDRGKKFWKKSSGTWVKTEITALGEKIPSGAIHEKNLTAEQQAEIAEQIEDERVAALSTSAKNAERTAALESAAVQAGIMKNKLEVQGDSQALKKAKDWMAEETSRIELKYS